MIIFGVVSLETAAFSGSFLGFSPQIAHFQGDLGEIDQIWGFLEGFFGGFCLKSIIFGIFWGDFRSNRAFLGSFLGDFSQIGRFSGFNFRDLGKNRSFWGFFEGFLPESNGFLGHFPSFRSFWGVFVQIELFSVLFSLGFISFGGSF